MTTRNHAIPSARAFRALDRIEDALIDVETTMVLFSGMVDHGIEDTDSISAIERHLRSTWRHCEPPSPRLTRIHSGQPRGGAQ